MRYRVAMPDRRRHRGPHRDDPRLFATPSLPSIACAADHMGWLMQRGYPPDASLKLVGDHHNLTARQRQAIRRIACSERDRRHRLARRVEPPYPRDLAIGIDGYNLLITIESALSGGLLLRAHDSTIRDLASMHGTYRRVEETIPAIDLIAGWLTACRPKRVDWYLDRPVSNSGRLKTLLGSRFGLQASLPETRIELLDNPDRKLAAYDGLVVSSDSAILDRARGWIPAVEQILATLDQPTWLIDVGSIAREPD